MQTAVRITAIKFNRKNITGVVVRILNNTVLLNVFNANTVIIRREAHVIPEFEKNIGVATFGKITDNGTSARLD